MAGLREQKGAFIPTVAIMILVLLLAVGLVVDLGHMYSVRTQLQRAVDASALAAAHRLVGTDTETIENNAEATAKATAAVNTMDSQPIKLVGVDDDGTVELTTVVGDWDESTDAFGDDPDDRFEPGQTPYDAVKVSATTEVELIFFWLLDTATVSADAIAVNLFQDKTIPFTLISCIQNDDTYLKPGQDVCDIAYFSWKADHSDTAGWTSLTYRPANQPNIVDIFDKVGLSEFNEIIYGKTPGESGLENMTVVAGPPDFSADVFNKDNSEACNQQNVGRSVVCGLGPDFVDPSATGDPLQDYNQSLPRWSDVAPPPPLSGPFFRIWSMGGTLTADTDQMKDLRSVATDDMTIAAYAAKYPDAIIPDATWLTDGRYLEFIDTNGRARYEKALQYAGYPLVAVNNGKMNSAIQLWLHGDDKRQLEGIIDDTNNAFVRNLVGKNPPFEGDGTGGSFGHGHTIQLTLPVVFMGQCENAKYQGDLPYTGLANLLVTRIWEGVNVHYDVGNTDDTSGEPYAVTATVDNPEPGCNFDTFNDDNIPEAPPAINRRFVGLKWTGGQAIEGLVQPRTKGEKTETGLRRIFLVK